MKSKKHQSRLTFKIPKKKLQYQLLKLIAYYISMKKTNLLKKLATTILTTSLLLNPVLAASAPIKADYKITEQEKNQFNPNYIISDKQMQNWQSMSQRDIQLFLEEQNSYLAYYKTKDLDGEMKRASEIIKRSARKHKINPKYILVKLQKEQSLIKDPNPTQKQLNWAAGYGVCDSCTTTDTDIQEHKGFASQVDSAAGIIRWYYDNVGSNSIVKEPQITYAIDDQQVKPANFATAFLYTYTPHIHGNKNFWKLWEKWFKQVYPDGSLVKTKNSPNVFLIKDGKKHKFENFSALTSRFNPNRIVTINAGELSRYETGTPISLPNYAILKVKSKNKYYLLDNDKLRPFADYDVVRKLGYHPGEIIDVEQDEIQQYKIGKEIQKDTKNPLGRLIKVKENNQLYYLKNKKYHPIADKKIAEVNFPNLYTETINAKELNKYSSGNPIQFKDGTLFGVKGGNKIYVVENGKKRHIKDEEVFKSLGYKWENIVWTNKLASLAHKPGEPLVYTSLRTERKQTKDKKSSSNKELQKLIDKIIKTPKSERSFTGPKFETGLEAYSVMSFNTGKVLASKNADFARPLASLTKVMTAHRIYKDNYNPNEIVSYNPKQHKSTYHRYKISKGEAVKNRDLMSAFLISSLNTPGNMLLHNKENDEVVQNMNQEVQGWGLKKTEFKGVTGEKVATKSTANEYANIFKKISKDGRIRNYLDQKNYEYEEVINKDERSKHFDKHSNKLLQQEASLPFEILASKTGYLHEAGANLAMLIKDRNTEKKYIIVTMGNPNLENKFVEPKQLAEWTLKQFN